MAIPSGGGATSSPGPAAPFTYPVLSSATLASVKGTGAAPPPAAGPSLASLAAGMASRDTNAELAAFRAQQQAANDDARARAAAINQMALGAAGFLKPLGDVTKQDYADALAQNTGLAQGYSGQLRTDALGAAGAAQNTLSAIPGNEQTIVNHGGSLADLLYGLRGSLPGQALVTEGLGATATARALPASTLAYGQTQAANALNAGRTAAAAYSPQIASAIGGRPALAQQYLTSLLDQQQKQAALNQPHITASGGGIYSIDPNTGAITTLKEPTPGSTTSGLHYYQDGSGREYLFDATTGKTSILPGAATPPSASSQSPYTNTYSTGGVEYGIRPDGSIVRLPGTPTPPSLSSSAPTTKTVNGVTYQWDASRNGWFRSGLPKDTTGGSGSGTGLSASSFNVALRDTKSQIVAGAKGTPAQQHYDSTSNTFVPVPNTGAPPVNVQTALANGYAAIPAGVKPATWKARVDGLVKAAYAPYIPQISTAAKAAVALGNDDAATTIQKIEATNAYPLDLVQRIVALTYRQSLSSLRAAGKTVKGATAVNIFGR